MDNQQRAFIFDMDGTIVDNMAFHVKSWLAFFERRGHVVDADEFFRTTAGRRRASLQARYPETPIRRAMSTAASRPCGSLEPA